jgi:hypothetical protein
MGRWERNEKMEFQKEDGLNLSSSVIS